MTRTKTQLARWLASASDVAALAANSLGAPVHLTVLKAKPGRRCTWRAIGPGGTAIAKAYASDRSRTVATRVAALQDGHPSVTIPTVLDVDEPRRIVILTDVAGTPWSRALHAGDHATAQAVGAGLASWHHRWTDSAPPTFTRHTASHELAALERQAGRLTKPRRQMVMRIAHSLVREWPCTTVVHRDLYEEQVLITDRNRIGLIDLDDAACGPPELDIGNVLAHLDLLVARHRNLGRAAADRLLDGYRERVQLDESLLQCCRRLSTLRLACIHDDLAAVVSAGFVDDQ